MNSTVILAILALLVVVIAWVLSRSGKHRAGEGTPRDQLLHLCLGDKKQMKRLVSFERVRSPEISRTEAEVRALESIRRDNT